MTAAYTDAWLREMWKTSRELPLSERLSKRESDTVQQALLSPPPVDNAVGIVDRRAS